MKLLTNIPSWLKNKFFIAFAAFAAIILFFDKNDLFTQLNRNKQLHDLQKSKEYYTSQIYTTNTELDKMRSDPRTLEKYAREKYLMKRDNEDLFIVPENYPDPKN